MHALFQKSRYDAILIWGHGMKYFHNILEDIRGNENFKIVKIEKYKPKNIKKFVKAMYSFDYAPYWHLKAKTKYLLQTEKEVCFIFIQNKDPQEDYLDEGSFRHKESLTLKKFKEYLRDKYNPYENGKRTHHHVVHATDSEEQTQKMLYFLGYTQGVAIFQKIHSVVSLPYYLNDYNLFHFLQIDVQNLYAKIVDGESWDNSFTKIVPLQETPHYLGLCKDMDLYEEYIEKFLGGALQEDYSVQRYETLVENFNYLQEPYANSFILVERVDDKYIILDGLHRASCYIMQGKKEIKVCHIFKRTL